MTFAEFEKARCRDGEFYLIAPRGSRKKMRQRQHAALDGAMDETDFFGH